MFDAEYQVDFTGDYPQRVVALTLTLEDVQELATMCAAAVIGAHNLAHEHSDTAQWVDFADDAQQFRTIREFFVAAWRQLERPLPRAGQVGA
jgi:hypothetical protein